MIAEVCVNFLRFMHAARVESDGNFVILCASGFWANLVYSRKETGFYMRLLDSGDLIVASRRSTLWTSNTADGLFQFF